MNVFVIPSWYPSVDEPQSGVFTLDQVVALAEAYPDSNFGISTWGQKAEAKLLWAKDHLKNLPKLLRGLSDKPSQRALAPNLWEYYTPTFTWSDKVLKGNMRNKLLANEKNLLHFQKQVGPVSLIHAHTSFPAGYIAWRLAEKYTLPFVITEHMGPFPFPDYLNKGKIMDKVLKPLKAAHAVVAVSPAAAEDIQHKTGVKPQIIPNLVDERLFNSSSLPSSGQPLHSFTFFSLGRMVPEKGFPDLLQAIKRMKESTATFRIGGSGKHLYEYQQLAEHLGVASRIRWLGELSREQVALEFTNCQAFVLTSIHESMGVVFAEALACGKPVIATRCGGPESMLTPKNSLLVDVHAPQQVASAMDTLIQAYSSYSASQIRSEFLNRFSSAIITQHLHTLYESIVAQQAVKANQ
jgi:glycosyltransferase involved in cell wall biosynthesis